MAFIPAVNCAELVLYGAVAGQQVNTVHHFLFGTAITTTNLIDLASNAIGEWINWVAPNTCDDYQLISTKATDLTTSSSPVRTAVPITAANGLYVNVVTPNNVALVISQATNSRGKSFRGRTYSPAIPIGGMQDGVRVTEAYRAACLAGWIGFWADLESDVGCTHVVLSRYSGGAARASGVMTPVTVVSANIDTDSMSSRLAGRGS